MGIRLQSGVLILFCAQGWSGWQRGWPPWPASCREAVLLRSRKPVRNRDSGGTKSAADEWIWVLRVWSAGNCVS